MLLLPIRPLLGALLVLQAPAPAPKHTWIADLKANRATLGTTEVRVQGDVVDIRSTSPTAKFGFYRLIDASDPAGLLVRTNQLPKEGGALRLRARLAVQQPSDGSLLLDEIEREGGDKQSRTALVLAVISALGLVTLGGLLIRAVIAERRYQVSPPLWLLPDAGPYGKGGVAVPGSPAPPLKYSPELEDADRKQRDLLQMRRRNLFQLTLGALALFAVSGIWLLLSRPASAQMPAFIFIEADDIPLPANPAPPPRGDTSLAVQPAIDSPPAPIASPRRKDTVRVATRPAPAPAPVTRPRVGDTVTVQPVTPAPAPPPPPPPPPPPAPEPPPVDPEVERTRAAAELANAAQSLVAAINRHRVLDLAVMLPEGMAGDLGRRERFMKLVKDFEPHATLGTIDPAVLDQTGAEARFAVSFSWRGDFGVDRRKTGRFLGIVRREQSGWRFQGARLLDAVP